MQQRVAVALAWLGKEADLRQSFVDRRGLDVLLELLTDQRRDASSHKEAAGDFSVTSLSMPCLLATLYFCHCACLLWFAKAALNALVACLSMHLHTD